MGSEGMAGIKATNCKSGRGFMRLEKLPDVFGLVVDHIADPGIRQDAINAKCQQLACRYAQQFPYFVGFQPGLGRRQAAGFK